MTDDGLQTLKRALHDTDRFARLPFIFENVDFIFAPEATEFGDGFVSNSGPAIAEMNDGLDAARVLHTAKTRFPVESGKKVIWKKRFGEPDAAAFGGAAEFDARQKDLQTSVALQGPRGEVLVFGLGPEAKPVH